jgi:hypothetical protein
MDAAKPEAHHRVMAEPAGAWCPRCLQPTGEVERCPRCGLPQRRAEVDRLRQIAVRMDEISRQQWALHGEGERLRQEQAMLFRELGAGPVRRAQPTGAGAAAFEWRWEVVRDLVLWLGAVLVGVAALIFAAVAWGRLSDVGRALFLFGATLLFAAGTALTYRRLLATAQALSGLTVVLVLVDWYVLRRAGLGAGWSETAWWALGTALAAVGSGSVSRWFPVQRVIVAVLAQISAVLLVGAVTGGPGPAGTGLAFCAAVAAGLATHLWRDRTWRHAAQVLAGGSGLMLLAASTAALSLLPPKDLRAALAPAAVIAAMGLAPAAARWRLRAPADPFLADVLVASAAAALLAAGATLIEAVWGGRSRLGPVAVLGLAGFAAGRIVPAALHRGTQFAGAGTVVLAALGVGGVVAQALAAPLRWAGDPWSASLGLEAARHLTPQPPVLDGDFDSALLVLAVLGAAAAFCFAPITRPCLVRPVPAVAVGVAAATALVAVLPLAAGWPLWATLATVGAVGLAALLGSALLDRGARLAPAVTLAAAGAVLAVTATGWALATEAGTLAWVGTLAAGGAAAAGQSSTQQIRLAFTGLASTALLGEVAAGTASGGGDVAVCGLTVAVAAGVLVAAGSHWRAARREDLVIEVAGLVGLVSGAALATASEQWLAVTLTAVVPSLALAGAAPGHRRYLWAAGWVAVTATWAWLALADVTVVEAYTLPAAAAALVSGAVVQRRLPALSSWATWGPGLVIGLFPTLVLAVAEPGLLRRLAVTAAGFGVVAAGARVQRQAPLVLGSLTLVVVALDALAPVATELPRWVTIGTVGLLLLWLGATAERRMAEFRRLRERFDELEPDGWSPFLRLFGKDPHGGARPV